MLHNLVKPVKKKKEKFELLNQYFTMDNIMLNKNYARFVVLVILVVIINLGIYYRSMLIPNVNYQNPIETSLQSIARPDCSNDVDVSQVIFNIPKQNTSNIKPSVFCIIKTHPDNIAVNKTLTVLNVWGRKCDNYR